MPTLFLIIFALMMSLFSSCDLSDSDDNTVAQVGASPANSPIGTPGNNSPVPSNPPTTTPNQPVQTNQPTRPNQPSQPNRPTRPNQPTQPNQPQPNLPTQPNQPQPNLPTQPNQPTQPNLPQPNLPQPIQPTQPATEIAKIIAHQNQRFQVLSTILARDVKFHIRFPGQNANNHALGTGIARGAWNNFPGDHQRMIDNITAGIHQLETTFPGRIHFGYIGDYLFAGANCDRTQANPTGIPGPQADGSFMIHVWGANDGNFNFDNGRAGTGWGAGQATCFATQRPGVFAISTMPRGDAVLLMAPDKLLPDYH